MDDYQLRVTYTDFYGAWKKIQPSIIHEGPLSICLQLNITNEDDTQSCPFFSPGFVESEDGNALCHLFIIGYDSKFDTNQTTAINIWRSKHPGTAFLVLILSIAKSQWSFTTQRSKIESHFLTAVPTSRIVIAKYLLDDQIVSESDIKAIHSSLANLIQISNQDRISFLQQQMEKLKQGSPEYIKTASELASLYHMFGFFSASKQLYRSIITFPSTLPFWPPSPKNYDIRRLSSKASFDYGFDTLISSIHGITKSLLQSNNVTELSDDISLCFATVLENAITPEQKVFARHWIHFTAVNLCDMLESGSISDNDDTVRISFSFIALTQILKLFEYNDGFDKNSPFLENVAKGNNALGDEASRDQLFLTEYSRSKKIIENYPYHMTYLSSIFFEFFAKKGDIKSAMASIENTVLDPTSKTNENRKDNSQENHLRQEANFNKEDGLRKTDLIDGKLLEMMFNHPDLKSDEIAISLLSSKASDKVKIDALNFLSSQEVEVKPDFSIFPHFHSPAFFDSHSLYESLHFKLTFKLPSWLCGLEAVVWVQLSSSELSEDYCLLCEMKKYKLESKMLIDSSINCNFAGVFDSALLIFQFDSVFLDWEIPIPHNLTIHEKKIPPSFDLLMPSMILKGCLQSGIFTAQNLDASSLEVSFIFEMDGLEDIIYCDLDGETKHFQPNTPIVLNKFESSIKMKLIYRMKEEDTIGVVFSFLRRDGNMCSMSQQFTAPASNSLNIRLFKQTSKLQQFQIVNIYPQAFSFEFEGKRHTMGPHALYSIVRKSSEEPLVLTFFEEGWEDYPVEIVTSNFMLDKMSVKLSFDNKKWTVGEPRLITVDQPAFAMMEDEKNWVVAPQDGEGRTHLLIPKHPGKLPFPKFQVMQQVAEPFPKYIEIQYNAYPPIIPF